MEERRNDEGKVQYRDGAEMRVELERRTVSV